ncbi:MAG: hypothetical protein QW303_02055 [Nitrososphaerota archaeon]
MEKRKKSHILFLSKVFLSNCPSEESILENIDTSEFIEPEEQFDSIPAFYTTYESWIKSTNLLCWSCSNKFDGMPWFIPIGLMKQKITKNDKVVEVIARQVYGNFCTPFCACRYINRIEDSRIRKWECKNMLIKLYNEITGNNVPDIPEAEDKTIMMQYCGPHGITVQEFRLRNEQKNEIYCH